MASRWRTPPQVFLPPVYDQKPSCRISDPTRTGRLTTHSGGGSVWARSSTVSPARRHRSQLNSHTGEFLFESIQPLLFSGSISRPLFWAVRQTDRRIPQLVPPRFILTGRLAAQPAQPLATHVRVLPRQTRAGRAQSGGGGGRRHVRVRAA